MTKMNIYRRAILFLFGVCALLIICATSGANCGTIDGLATCDLKCDVPQVRSLNISKLLNLSHHFHPHFVVLHRCDGGTGCCKAIDSICQVAKMEEIKIKLLVRHSNSTKYIPQIYEVNNHTQCSCQHIKNDIK